jgi:F-box interacting protein
MNISGSQQSSQQGSQQSSQQEIDPKRKFRSEAMSSSQQGRPNPDREKRQKLKKSSQVVIPQDLVIYEILPRLPVKSFVRLKAVSKLWNSTISSPDFQRRCPATLIIALKSYNSNYHPQFYTLDKKGSIQNFRLPDECEYGCNYTDDCKTAVVSNSCNGMLLLRLGKRIFLFNPSTHYIRIVLTLDDRYEDKKNGFKIGFCYDESIDDYKAVILPSNIKSDKPVLVASLKKKEWTTLCYPREFNRISPGPFVNGRLHALAGVGYIYCDFELTAYNTIIYFNPTNDVFEKVACPLPKSEEKHEIVGLGVLDGCLCMARWGLKGPVEVLKMGEYGVAESWTILFALQNLDVPRYQKCNLLLSINDDEILIKNGGSISSYNLANNYYYKCIVRFDFFVIKLVPII